MAPTAWSIRRASRARVMRVSRWSSGIQLAPRANTGAPLIRSTNAEPYSSAEVSSSTVRSPMRRCQLSRRSSSTGELDVDLVQRLRAVPDRPPEVGVGDRTSSTADDAPGWSVPVTTTSPTRTRTSSVARPPRGPSARRRRARETVASEPGDGDERADRGQAGRPPPLDATPASRAPRSAGRGPSPSRSCRPSCGPCSAGPGTRRGGRRCAPPPARRASGRWRSRRRASVREPSASDAHVEPVAAVHVGGAGDLDAAQRDRRDGVEALEDEVDALVVDAAGSSVSGRS